MYPVELRGDPAELAYAWIPFADTGSDSGAACASPRVRSRRASRRRAQAGFYRLALVKGSERVLVDGPALSVMVPFSAKLGSTLNGYRIGTYLAERLGARTEEPAPPGFVEIDEDKLDLPLTKHLRLSDFVTHDNQESWPRYAALDARLLDKIELVVAEIGRLSGKGDDAPFELDVHSGFRTPLHNRRVKRAARDSRHQYGDAADIAIDSNGDGKHHVRGHAARRARRRGRGAGASRPRRRAWDSTTAVAPRMFTSMPADDGPDGEDDQ